MNGSEPDSGKSLKGPWLPKTYLFVCLGLGLAVLFCLAAWMIMVQWNLGGLNIIPSPTINIIESPSLLPSAITSFTPSLTPSFTPFPTFSPTATFTPSVTPTRTFTPSHTPTPSRTPTRTPRPTFTSSPTEIPYILGDSNYRITYQGWEGRYNDRALGVGYRCSSQKGETATYTSQEKSNSITLITLRGPNQGKAQVIIDNEIVETLNLYLGSPQYQYQKTYEGLSFRKHTITVKVLHQKRNDSGGYDICIDGFIDRSTVIDDNNPDIQYSVWAGKRNENSLGGYYRLSTSKNAFLTFTIKGTSFTWLTALGPNYGKAEIFVDGVYQGTTDHYNREQTWQYNFTISGLSNHEHTIKIVVIGQRNSASKGYGVVFDGYFIP